MPNRLIHETSPYLRQHAHNPVDWYPWGPEALDRARTQGLPIFLSIGYAACHWCHVMERESFEDPDVAAVMNRHFVNVKVDREERPDLDSIYMQAVQALTGRGGWPMSLFLTPELKPFYGGTYFPPQDRGGMPSFRRVLETMAELFAKQQTDVTQSAEKLTAYLKQSIQTGVTLDPLTAETLGRAYQQLAPDLDTQHGGFGHAPKFPQAPVLEFLLRYGSRVGDQVPRVMVELTLDRMARGGIYDQLAGGFHRYSTDQFWLVPHFEKMLYDNALLTRTYLHAFQATGDLLYRRVVEETLDYALRDMRDPAGGFYSSQDADSEGDEGKFYVWSRREVLDLLGTVEGDLFSRYYGITQDGNFGGAAVLYVSKEPSALAAEMRLPLRRLEEVVARGRQRLHEARRSRVWPARDDKVLTSWNGMMLTSLAEAAAVLDHDGYRQAAVGAATFLLDALRPKGRLLRSYRDGVAGIPAYLEDYALLIEGLVALYEATSNGRWLTKAHSLADEMLELFRDSASGLLFDTSREHDTPLLRPRDIFDNPMPCGGSAASMALLKLSALTGVHEYREHAAQGLRSIQEWAVRAPGGFGHWLCALDLYLSTPKEVVIVGDRQDRATGQLLEAVHRSFLPNKVVLVLEPGGDATALDPALVEAREMLDDRPTAYVCEEYVCQMPVTTPQALAEQLTVTPEEPFVPGHGHGAPATPAD